MAENNKNANAGAKNNQNTPNKNTSGEVARKDALSTDHGRTVIEDQVVGKIAGLAAREVSGVYALGGGAARMLGSIRESFGASDNVQQGVDVEVGESQAAVDLSIVAEYGVAIHELAEAIRRNIIRAIERMTGLEVTEVNVTVTDVHLDLGDDEETKEQPAEDAPRRVQ
ncbi:MULTISPECIES: Asp23/Gls24 family envelope stress response protein [unclassified Corynebacterium]|uniref:Asp23/Gls24 family envelope stress response protein n=1 Tax=unclassified Corynebacterium TaxID=2624378 RepID=UPI0029CA4CF2|nr:MULTISPECIES: Asp23/Gls24 family envelope stress response protein [unclassified Corynebacterium]WPF66473.1 Asp23/Gls24 family envelope stress response protein [Corynebacterium sp. 22KM0430]WPF68963.1 Asp23/Gls24 family envelope stress response protein [Corynebacterium sp. 21KM1197]